MKTLGEEPRLQTVCENRLLWSHGSILACSTSCTVLKSHSRSSLFLIMLPPTFGGLSKNVFLTGVRKRLPREKSVKKELIWGTVALTSSLQNYFRMYAF